MKKLVAAGCCIIALQNFSQVAAGNEALDLQNGRKGLIRAIAVIVNADAVRKTPAKRIHVPNVESPQA